MYLIYDEFPGLGIRGKMSQFGIVKVSEKGVIPKLVIRDIEQVL
jgi:hypothetical protein